ncbi:MAG: hypothetical protein HYU80_04530 [Candidatus Blackburnbacteria bacterium]|nr:hypothetical protein [Candidatus Blackburnbacteria bacterium]
MGLKVSFTENQLKMLAVVAADAGQVFFAITVVPFLISPSQTSLLAFFFGISLTLACWVASLILTK